MAIDKNYTPSFYKSTANMTTEEWEDERRNSLGGSDMAVLLGVSPYETTKLDIYNQKMGIKPVIQSNPNRQIIFNAGHFLENMVSNLFSYRTGYEAYEIKAMFEHPRAPYLRGNIDRFYRRHGEKEPIGFLECKTTSEYKRGEWSDDQIPTQYKVQISTYLSILNMEMCKISCLFIPESLRWVAGILFQMKAVFGTLTTDILMDLDDQLKSIKDVSMEPYVPMVLSAIGGEMLIPKQLLADCSDAIGQNLVIQEFQRDEALEEWILLEAERFWKQNVEKRIPPSLKGEKGKNAIATLNKYVKSFSLGRPVALPDGDALAETAQKIEDIKKKKSALASKSKALDAQLEKLAVPFIEALDGADMGEFSANGKTTLVTYKSGLRKSVSTANIEKLKNHHPDIYKEYVTEKKTNPSLKIK